jgi:hypothetical protein
VLPDNVTPVSPPVRAYPPEAILDIEQVAEWLQVSTRTVARLPIRSTRIGHRTRRYLAKHVLEYLERLADNPAKPALV